MHKCLDIVIAASVEMSSNKRREREGRGWDRVNSGSTGRSPSQRTQESKWAKERFVLTLVLVRVSYTHECYL